MANEVMNSVKRVLRGCIYYCTFGYYNPSQVEQKQQHLDSEQNVLPDPENDGRIKSVFKGKESELKSELSRSDNKQTHQNPEQTQSDPQQLQLDTKETNSDPKETQSDPKQSKSIPEQTQAEPQKTSLNFTEKKEKKKKKTKLKQPKQKTMSQCPAKENQQEEAGIQQELNSEPKSSSRNALKDLSKKYYIEIACGLCSVPGKNHKKLEYREDLSHDCQKNCVLMKPRQEEMKHNFREKAQWYEIRPKPVEFTQYNVNCTLYKSSLCEPSMSGEGCKEEVCSYPHNHIEIDLWNKELRPVNPINLMDFFCDLRYTKLSDELQKYNAKPTDLCREKLEKLNREKNNQNEPCESEDLQIAEEQKKGKKKKKDRRNKHGSQDFVSEVNVDIEPPMASTEQEEETTRAIQSESATTRDVNDLTWKPWNPSDVYEIEVPDSTESESIPEEAESDMGTGNYYQIHSEDDCTVNEFTKPDEYKRCIIYLDGKDQAKCQPVDTDDPVKEIEIRGRHNCGTAFDLDEVLVQIITSDGSTDTDKDLVTRGRVVRVLTHSCDRKSYVFLCTWTSYCYQSHLLTPVCGKVPKIYIKPYKENEDLKSVVAIYENNGWDMKGNVDLAETDPAKLLFVVKYIQWKSHFKEPYGFVVHVIKPSSNLECQQSLLNILYQIPTKHSKKTLTQIKRKFPDEDISKNIKKGGEDMTHLLTFTIDPEGCQDMDDALSIRQLVDGGFEVYVHISHVAKFVERNSPLDVEAKQRGKTFYPIVDGVKMKTNMLPDKLSRVLCSLEPGKDRLVISFHFKFKEDGEHVDEDEEPEIKSSVIRSDHKLSYQTVQNILDGDTDDIGIRHKLQWLKLISQKLRKSRAGRYHLFQKLNEDTHDARMIVEEMMILTNRSVAKIIKEKFTEGVPLKKQDPPHEESLKEWNEQTGGITHHSVYFDRYKDLMTDQVQSEAKISILRGVWQEIIRAREQSNVQTIKLLFGLEDVHPIHATSMQSWISIQRKSKFICHEASSQMESSHFSLKMEEYVQCTSPIRRYMDLVVQRILLASLKNKKSPYSKEMVEEQCEHTNRISTKDKQYHNDCHQMKSAHKIHVTPQIYPVIILSVKDGTLKILVPHLRNKMLEIKFQDLKLMSNPITEALPSSGVFVWEKRLYCNKNDKVPSNAKTMQGKQPVQLNPNANVVMLNPNSLSKIHELMDSDKDKVFLEKTQSLLKTTTMSKVVDVTSETKNNKQPTVQGCQFELSLQSGSVLQAQIGGDLQNGMLQLNTRLLRLTPTLDICLHHVREPIQSFATIAVHKMKKKYEDMKEYRDIVLPILAMEAVTSVVTDAEPIVISNVDVFLKKDDDKYYGEFKLSVDFCKSRQIPLLSRSEEKVTNSLENYLCIRCQQRSETDEKFLPGLSVWVGHAVTTKAEVKEGFLNQHFQINQMSELPPEGLLHPGGKDGTKGMECTIEILIKSLPHRRMEQAVKKLPTASSLCQNIIRGGMATTDKKTNLEKTFDIDDLPDLPPNNELQKEAIRNALDNPFTVIQGPPGTGKTLTGVKIAYWLTENNKKTKKKQQLLYCGPSNNSVDVAAKTMRQRLGDKCPKIIRVYSEAIEYLDYPVPRETSSLNKKSKKDLSHMKDIKEVTLHHLVRQSHNSQKDELQKYDEIFKKHMDKPDNVTDKTIEEYKKVLMKAAMEELERYDIIFCTCTASACGKMKKGANIKQIIIDECGMCMEPESLVPMVTHGKAEQIILIGDHKQLRPIVKNRTAQNKGLNVSLFERYAEKKITMLTEQYRMHQVICDFPSDHFYSSELITPEQCLQQRTELTIWRERNVPLVFCHVEGVENSQSITTVEGNLASKSNKQEIKHVCRICKELIEKHGVKEHQISILSQYKAQVTEIKKELKNVNVGTVVASQGAEWDYVILSCVRSLPKHEIDENPSDGWMKKNLGFIRDPNQINVAITRARKGLIIIGNENLLKLDPMWCHLLEFYKKKKSLVPAAEFPTKY